MVDISNQLDCVRATDVEFLVGGQEKTPYEIEACTNIEFLLRQGIDMAQGWDVFLAGSKWNEEENGTVRLVVASGLWHNCATQDRAEFQCRRGSLEFLSLANESLRMGFPSALVLHIQAQQHMQLVSLPGMLCCKLVPGHGITFKCPPYGHIISGTENELVACITGSNLAMVIKYLVHRDNETLLDVIPFIVDHLRAEEIVLFVGANRFQLPRLIVETIIRNAPSSLQRDARPIIAAKEKTLYEKGYVEFTGTYNAFMREASIKYPYRNPQQLARYWRDNSNDLRPRVFQCWNNWRSKSPPQSKACGHGGRSPVALLRHLFELFCPPMEAECAEDISVRTSLDLGLFLFHQYP